MNKQDYEHKMEINQIIRTVMANKKPSEIEGILYYQDQIIEIANLIKARTLAEDAERITKQTRAALAQPEERNFCPRCGKRTPDLTTVHTCTPPGGIKGEA